MAYKVNFTPGSKLLAAELNENFQALVNDWYKEEDLTSQVDGSAVIFTSSEPFVPGKLRVFVDGVRRRRNVDFIEISPTSFQWLGTALEVGQTLDVEYQKLVVT